MEVIGRVFSEVPQTLSSSAKNIQALLQQFQINRNVFITGLTQCFLQIIKNILKAPQMIIDRYQKFTNKIFETLYNHFVNGAQTPEGVSQQSEDGHRVRSNSSNNRRQPNQKQVNLKNQVFTVFQYFLKFFSDGMESPYAQIKIHCGRIVFSLVKILSPEDLTTRIDPRVSRNLINATLSMFRDKQSNLKILAIKIASFLQYLRQLEGNELESEIQELRSEQLRAMCQDEKEMVRKLALDNLELNDESFPQLIKRLRDQNSDIRCNVFRQLIKEQVPLSNLTLPDIYKLVYDGIGSREKDVYINTRRYLEKNFNLFKDEATVTENANPLSEQMEIMDENVLNNSSSMIRREKQRLTATPHKEGFFREMRVKLLNFLRTFEIQRSLLYPAIYERLDMMVQELIQTIVEPEQFSLYLRHLLSNCLIIKKNSQNLDIEPEELFLLRALCSMMYPLHNTQKQQTNQQRIDEARKSVIKDNEERREVPKEIIDAVQDCFPNGIEFAKVLATIHDPPNSYLQAHNSSNCLLAFYQTLLLAEMTINCDEAGQQKMADTLRTIVLNIKTFDTPIPENEEQREDYWNDIYFCQKVGDMKNLMFSQSYNQTPIIPSSNQLLTVIMRIYKRLTDGDSNIRLFSNKVVELISELREPLEPRQDIEDDDNNAMSENLNLQIEEINKFIEAHEQKRNEIELQLDNIRQNKPRQAAAPTQEEYNFQREKEKCEQLIKDKEEELEVVREKSFFINLRSLILAQSLLQTTPVDPQDPSIKSLLLKVIWPSYSADTTDLKAYGYQALALFVMLDQSYVQEYYSVFVEVLQEHVAEMQGEDSQQSSNKIDTECNPLLVTSLRALVDMVLMYGEHASIQEKQVSLDINLIADLLMKFSLKGQIFVRMLAIEGLCKLLFNERIVEPVPYLTVLLTVWFDNGIVEAGGQKTIQIISTFFKSYAGLSAHILQIFGKAFQTYIHMLIEMTVRKLEFAEECISYQPGNEETWETISRVGINLLSYQEHAKDQWMESFEHGFGAQQKYLFFLCKRALKGSGAKFYAQILEQIICYFDFIDHQMPQELWIIQQFLEEVVEQIDNRTQFDRVISSISLKIGDYKEPQNFEQQITRVIEKIQDSEQECNTIMQNFRDLQIIVSSEGPESKGRMSLSRINSSMITSENMVNRNSRIKTQNKNQQEQEGQSDDGGQQELDGKLIRRGDKIQNSDDEETLVREPSKNVLKPQQNFNNLSNEVEAIDDDSGDSNMGGAVEKQQRVRKQATKQNIKLKTEQPKGNKKRKELQPIVEESPLKSHSQAPLTKGRKAIQKQQ